MGKVLKPDSEWIRTRRLLLKQVQAEVAKRLGPESSDLVAYRNVYEKELKKSWKPASRAELLKAIAGADLVYGGDFHALGQAQRTHLKILRSLSDLLAKGQTVTLALEAFPIEAQPVLDQYLRGQLTLHEVKAKSRWSEVWGFPWENYRPLLELAYVRGFKLLALNKIRGRAGSGNDLQKREQFAAKLLARAVLTEPSGLVYAIFGDLHLAPQHLPSEVLLALKTSKKKQVGEPQKLLKAVTIFLNAERIYFQLARQGLEHSVDVVKFREGVYCVVASPPWVQWQSYLLFLDQLTDTGLEDTASGVDDDGIDVGSIFDPTDQVSDLIRLVARDLNVQMKANDLAIYGSDDKRIWNYLEQNLSLREKKIARGLISESRSFFIPAGGVGYLSQPTVNHAAQLAGHYLHAKLSGRKRILWNFPDDFKALVWTEASGFFISKLVNHKRQSETLSDLQTQLELPDGGAPAQRGRALARSIGKRANHDEGGDQSASTQAHREALRLALDQRMSELVWLKQGRVRRVRVKPRRKSSYLEAARILGGMMGERLYLAYRSRRLKASDVVELLRQDLSGPNFEQTYEAILKTIDGDGRWLPPPRQPTAENRSLAIAKRGISRKERL